jgi:hypothetical protein
VRDLYGFVLTGERADDSLAIDEHATAARRAAEGGTR